MTSADLEKGKGYDQPVEKSSELQDDTGSTDECTAHELIFLNRLPKPLRRIFLWTKGPLTKRQYSIKPLCAAVQRAPIDILDRLCRRAIWKKVSLLFVILLWLFLFTFLVQRNETPPQVPGFGSPKRLSCAASLW
jgi:hypothetical protein